MILWLKSRVNHKKTHVQLLRKVPTNSRHPQTPFGKSGQSTGQRSLCRCRPTLLKPRGHSPETDVRGIWHRQRELPVPQAFPMRGQDAQLHITEAVQRDRCKLTAGLCEEVRRRIAGEIDGGEDRLIVAPKPIGVCKPARSKRCAMGRGDIDRAPSYIRILRLAGEVLLRLQTVRAHRHERRVPLLRHHGGQRARHQLPARHQVGVPRLRHHWRHGLFQRRGTTRPVRDGQHPPRDKLLPTLRIPSHPKLRRERGRTVHQKHRQDQRVCRSATHQQNQQQTCWTNQLCATLIPSTSTHIILYIKLTTPKSEHLLQRRQKEHL